MRSFQSINAFVQHLARVEAALHAAQRHGEHGAGELLAHETKDTLGREKPEWPALADSTVADKSRHGYTGRISATDPLYRTGELRVSISFQVDGRGVIVGSSDRIAPYHEFGTSKMPARSFLGLTMFKHGHEAADLIAAHVVAAVGALPVAMLHVRQHAFPLAAE